MKIADILRTSERPTFSIEVLPPLKGNGIDKLLETVDALREFDLRYINITNHRSEYVYHDMGDGLFRRDSQRRRPGTVAVAAALQHRYGLPVVPHILCSGFSREETEYLLIDLQLLGITDLLVLRGDKAKHESVFTPEANGYAHAVELQAQVNAFNDGLFIDGSRMRMTPAPFSYGVACYPEKHDEAPNMDTDLQWLRAKQDAGAEYAVTQLFYDNRRFFAFCEQARAAGITIPIVPGIKPLRKQSQLSVVPKTFKVDLPEALTHEALKCNSDAEVERVGVEWCVQQCRELLAHGVPGLHFYTVGATAAIREVAAQVY